MTMKGDAEDLVKRVYAIADSVENNITQPQLSEERFRQLYFYHSHPQQSILRRLKNIKFSSAWVLKLFPILQWLPHYKKKHLGDDAIAGLTVAIMHIPQGMAYALLGGVPPIVGIYMAFFPVLIYTIMGTSRHVSMGTFAVVCMMVGKSVDAYSHLPEQNLTESSHQELIYEPPTATELATVMCFIVGIWQIILSILKFGSLSVLLSRTLISGFTTGAAVHVLTSQIRNLLGIKGGKYVGPFKVVYSYIDIFQSINSLNPVATVLSLSFLLFLFVFNELIKPYLQKIFKRAIPIPVELLVVIIGTLLSQKLNMKEQFGLAVVDAVPTGLPKPRIPPLHFLSAFVMDGLITSIVALSINISMATIFAQRLGYEIDANQEILASGLGNVFASFFSCMPFAASLSRSLIQQSAGGQTQITSVVSCLSLVFVLLYVGPFFEPLPYCVLSTIIVVALKGMFKQTLELPQIFRNSKMDGLVWIVTFLGVVLLDIDYGLCIGFTASLLILLIHCQNLQVMVLGRIPNTQIYVDKKRFKKSQTLSKILILQVIGGLHFANSDAAKKKIMTSFLKFFENFSAAFICYEKQNKFLSLVIDLSCVPFVDSSAIKTLRMLSDDLKALRTNLLLCGCVPSVYDSLEKSEYFRDYPKFLIFHSVQDAVEYAKELDRKNLSVEEAENVSKF